MYDVLGQMVGEGNPNTDFKKVDQALDSLVPGNIAFDVPAVMELDSTHKVRLLLSLREPIAQLENELRAGTKAERNIEGRQIRVATYMEAHLTGPAFKITPDSPPRQAVSEKYETSWQWEVTPTVAGPRQYLHVTLDAILYINGTKASRKIKSFDSGPIMVRVRLMTRVAGFTGNHWDWVWATLIAPLLLLLWQFLKKRLPLPSPFRAAPRHRSNRGHRGRHRRDG